MEGDEVNGNVISSSENCEVNPLVTSAENSILGSTADNPIIIDDDSQDFPVSVNETSRIKCEISDIQRNKESSSIDIIDISDDEGGDSTTAVATVKQENSEIGDTANCTTNETSGGSRFSKSLTRSNGTSKEEESDEDDIMEDDIDDEDSDDTSGEERCDNRSNDVRSRFSYIAVQAPNYELRKLLCGSTHLYVFTSEDHTHCYRYYPVPKTKSKYRCSECMNKKRKTTYASIKKNSGGEDFVEMDDTHTCDMVKYYGKNVVEVLYFEYYEKENDKELFIFDSKNKTSYYRFMYDAKKKIYACSRCHNFGKSTEAVIKTENDQEIVEADSIHACQPLPYIPKVEKPNFLLRKSSNGNPELVVFHNGQKLYLSILLAQKW
uniref:Uncharacterized protein n=1 Tax=Panagrolaimus superbus TaxID=310955 RepID=A0A914Z5J6_9BILA